LIVVVNRHKHEVTANDYYIGRGTPLGNPFEITETRSRDEAIALYKPYILEKIKAKDVPVCNMLNNIYREAKRGNVFLLCSCKPLSCHGDFIKGLIEEKLPRQTP
jgi:hypothetical protein